MKTQKKNEKTHVRNRGFGIELPNRTGATVLMDANRPNRTGTHEPDEPGEPSEWVPVANRGEPNRTEPLLPLGIANMCP